MKQLREYQSIAIKEAFDALKESDDPILFVMSVGGGKSICAGTICKKFQDLNKNVLCLVNSAELVRNNSLAFHELGGLPSIFCASLNTKEYKNNIIFATPQSILSAIKKNHPLTNKIFNLIIVDEAHGISYKQVNSCFMRILRHYKQEYPPMRLLGLTGTPFRLDNGETESIIGKNALFKKSVANITTTWLIDNYYLVKPKFGITNVDSIDMSTYHIEKSSKNKHIALDKIVTNNKRLTWEILQEVQVIMKKRNGAFIFCSTIAHCHEAVSALPEKDARIIIGSTSDLERNQILSDARDGKIKYLISVSCLLVGIDVPFFCTSVFLRPTQSLTLFMQAIGRSLRLHPKKKDALILDYAQNLETFNDLDHPIINEAIQPKESDREEDYPIHCFTCGSWNSLFQRRCRGVIDGRRCEQFFEWRDCKSCGEKNDQCARQCRSCQTELIDPNAKLHRQSDLLYLDVLEAKYWLTSSINAQYKTNKGYIFEAYYPYSEKAKNVFYARFIKHHVPNASDYWSCMDDREKMIEMINGEIKTPSQLICKKDKWDRLIISKKIFENNI